jgi:hypothetical protein
MATATGFKRSARSTDDSGNGSEANAGSATKIE